MTETSEKKIVLITGANKGIGLATAAVLARSGHTVLLGARDGERGSAAAARLAAAGLVARFVPLDVTDAGTIAAAAALIDADYGRLDILVNNAGISRDRPHSPTGLPVGLLRETYETNVFGVVAVNAVSPGYVATDLNDHSGHLSAEEAGANIARQITGPDREATGVFLGENGGTYAW